MDQSGQEPEREGMAVGRGGPSGDHLAALARELVCHLTTRGRRTGNPHEIEIWFAVDAGPLYLMAGSGNRADWVRNLRADPRVLVRFGARVWPARARFVVDPAEEAQVRRLLAAKYQGWRDGLPLSRWAQTALPVAVEFE